MTAETLNDPAAPIVLIGMMGAGKTTIGRILAKKMHRQFIDLDHEIVDRCGVSIATIFDLEGEAGFRKREHQVLEQVLQIDNLVLATGGGAIITPENRELLSRRCRIVYLKASPGELYHRVARDKSRPLLQQDNPRQVLTDLLEARKPFYEGLAHYIIPSGGESISSAALRIKNLLEKEPA